MIIRKIHLLIIGAHLICTSLSQNERSYDTNDWIPITQKTSEDSASPKKATGRVLNLDTPAQKFFPDEFLYKKSRPNFQSRPKHKDRYELPKYENTYKFEVPPSLPQNGLPQKYQFQYPQEIQLPNYKQPPLLDIYPPPPPRTQYVPNPQAIQVPPPNQPSIYQQYQQLPPAPPLQPVSAYNTTYYQTISPLSINQELVSGIQYQNIQGEQEKPILQSTETGNGGKDNVQLVYVPLENLKGNQQAQPVPQDSQNIYRQVESPRYEIPIDKPHRLAAIEQDFIQQALHATKLQEQIQQGEPLVFQIATTPKPIKKRKPHQPPLAVYLEGEKQQADITDVLSALQDAKTIAVQDNIQPGSPQIFIGPSTLESPEYTKFPLPYLNSLEGNRINKKIDHLPFFVAPLSFKTPPGYSKIPLPAPHVGSVVISHKEDLHGKRSTPRPNQVPYESTKQIAKDETSSVTQKIETLTSQPYFGQTYYDQESFVNSQQPQLVQYPNQNNQYNGATYSPQIVENDYNLPLRSQPEVTTQPKNEIGNTKAFHYSFIDESTNTPAPKNTYNQPKAEELSYNEPPKSLSYTGPQTYEQEEVRPYQQQYTDYNKQNDDQYRVQQVRYEPISTTFDSNAQAVVNTKPKPEHTQNQQKANVPDVSPLELAINEFELHEINTQLEEKPKNKHQYNYKTKDSNEDTEYKFDPELHRFSSTPATILRDSYETTTRPTSKPRSRIRNKTKATTLPPPEVETYTVLEEYSVKQKPDQSNIHYTAQREDVQTEQIPYSQKYIKPSYSSEVTEIEQIPSKIYNLNTNTNAPVYTESPSSEYAYTLNQNLMDQQILHSKYKQSSPTYEQQGQFEVHPQQYTIQPNIETTRDHRIQSNIETTRDHRIQPIIDTTRDHRIQPNIETTRDHRIQPNIETTRDHRIQPNIETTRHYLTDYSKDEERSNEYPTSFEDPSVRTLLVPKLLVPTTANTDAYTGPTYLPTTETIRFSTTTTTTERPIETTTQSRTRSRTRGGNRFNTHSTTKRPITRRRPTSRVTTERTTRYTDDNDYGSKNSNTKTRFRTRGRTTPNSITERQPTTENEIHEVQTPEPAVKIRTHPDGSESYMQYEHSVDPQKIIAIKPEEQEYSRVYATSTRPIIQYDNTAASPRPNINVQVTHPEDEEVSREKVRVRGRIRDRPSSTTSTERVVTRRITSKPVEKESSEEFYGFFRQPDFDTPAETRIDVPTTTPRHRVYSYQTPSQHGEDYQLSIDNTQTETSTIKFVGEIVPKYTTTKEAIVETETPKPRIRYRTRVPQKKLQPSQNQEQSTRRTNIIRTRGKAHYKLPQNLKKEKEDDDDIEGGNYPAPFLQGRRGVTTPSSNFQITVAPDDEEDQALNPSLYRPNVVASPEEWHDTSEYDTEESRKTNNNFLDAEENLSTLTDDQPNQPYALPVKTITEKVTEIIPRQSSDETFKETTKKIEEQFEAINNFDEEINTDIPTKQQRKKGVWKLVKHRPVDRLETSESQNYFSVLNSFHDIQKINDDKSEMDNYQKPVTEDLNEPFVDQEDYEEKTEKIKATYTESTTVMAEEDTVTTIKVEDNPSTVPPSTISINEDKEDFIDSIYEMFGISRQNELKSTTEVETTPPVTTTIYPTFPEELTEPPSNSSTANATETALELETTTPEDFFTTPQLEAKHEIKTSTFDVQPWEMKEVRTSTSTEVSHETEICYRGRCVRSQDKKKKRL